MRTENILTMLMILDYFLKIMLYTKRNKLNHLIRSLIKLYIELVSQNSLKYLIKLIFLLALNDIFTISQIMILFLTTKPSDARSYHYKNFTYGYFCEQTSIILFFSSSTMDLWTISTPAVTMYFCCSCFILKVLVKDIQKNIRKDIRKYSDGKFEIFEDICIKILDLKYEINESFHDFLLAIIVILVGVAFYHLYSILTTNVLNKLITTYHALIVIAVFSRFLIICVLASSTSKALAELKKYIHSLSVHDNNKWEFVRLVLKIDAYSVEFKILDGLVVDKNLILTTVGGIVTYGIIIATFNISGNI